MVTGFKKRRCIFAPAGLVEIDGSGTYDGPAITNSSFTNSLENGIAAETNIHQITNDYSQGGNTFSDNAGMDYPDASQCP